MFLRFLTISLLLFALLDTLAERAAAGHPSYLILQTPPSGRHITHGGNPGTPQVVGTPAYSYGYFGVSPRQHASRHHGYYNNYNEKSYR